MITGKILRDAYISGAVTIANRKKEVDRLNVYPVPDGDTGTNMSMTMGNALREIQFMDDNSTVAQVAETAASALLRGARGNSGVILSLLFRGFAKGFQGNPQRLRLHLPGEPAGGGGKRPDPAGAGPGGFGGRRTVRLCRREAHQ